MITEKEFIRSHHGFWRNLLPMSEHFIREQNVVVSNFESALVASAPSRMRGLANETAFLIFAEAVRLGYIDISRLDRNVVLICAQKAFDHVKRMRAFDREAPSPLDDFALTEAQLLAQRTLEFFDAHGAALQVQPRFPGCGWLDECFGDVLSGETLFEIKAGDRSFLSVDLQQLLIYAALNFSSKAYEIQSVGLMNPRLGNFFQIRLDLLCQRLAGRSAIEVLAEIVDYISEPISRYSAVDR